MMNNDRLMILYAAVQYCNMFPSDFNYYTKTKRKQNYKRIRNVQVSIMLRNTIAKLFYFMMHIV